MNKLSIHKSSNYVELSYRDGPLFRYVYAPEDDLVESPKPYFHPLRTLAGNEVTVFRPHDHIWHKGLAMTAANLSGQNFWGGPTYVRDEGYVQLENNGRMEHQTWDELRCEGDGAALAGRLAWISSGGEVWISEERRIEVGDIEPDEGYWSLDLRFNLENVSGRPLIFGSPTTEGRPLAGYGGLFWRGPRSFSGGDILAAGGLEGPQTMGQPAPWLGYIGQHDGNLDKSSLMFLDHPGNPRYPNKWFARNEPYACVSCSFMFDEEYVLEEKATLSLNYRVVLGDEAWSRQRFEAYAQSWAAGVSGKETV